MFLLIFLPVYSAEINNYVNKEDIETSKRIFIVKPEKDIKNTTETEEKKTETSSSVPTQNHTEKDKNTLVIMTTDHGNANPGVIYGKNANVNFDSIQKYTHTNEWLLNQIGIEPC